MYVDNIMAHAHPVHLDTIFIQKRRFTKIGIDLEGTGHPNVIRSRSASFLAADTLYIINGRETIGARHTSWRIFKARYLSITVWRAV